MNHLHPVRDWTLPHQIVLTRLPSGRTGVGCVCGTHCGDAPPSDAPALLRLYHSHLAKAGAA